MFTWGRTKQENSLSRAVANIISKKANNGLGQINIQPKPAIYKSINNYDRNSIELSNSIMRTPQNLIQRNETDAVEEEVEDLGQQFRDERRAQLGGIIAGMRFRKVLRDCPRSSRTRMINLLRGVRQRAVNNPACRRFFQRHFRFGPERVLDLNRPPTVMIDPRLTVSGRTRCPGPSVRFQPAICTSRLRDRVIMHELIHYAGCIANNRPAPHSIVNPGENICIGTVAQELERQRRR
ncbi:SprT-like domain-containing protein [Draconibacterium sp.]|nr:SprT-like domain-containing protein [Draconibacterium sp.]